MSELNFQEIMEVRNQTNAFARSIGLGLTFLEEGHAVTEMDITENQLNPIGSVHGGCLYTAADVAAERHSRTGDGLAGAGHAGLLTRDDAQVVHGGLQELGVLGGAAISFGDVVTTVDSSFRYLRPGLNTTRIKADAVAVKHGKRLTVIQVNVFNQNDTLLCIGTFSFMSVDV